MATSSCIEAPSSPHAGRADDSRSTPPRQATAPSNGFNDEIAWRSLDEGLAEAATTHRPLMLVVHASWCSSCQALKPSFRDASLVGLSHDFVMINLDQDVEPRSLEFAPDGDYIPRVVFLEPQTGRPDPTILNQRRANRRFYYGPQDDIVGAMKKALARHGET
jgi:thiol-disulfide isomerase/thioredoxin